MASFIEDLWTSVFTPGPTPTLLIATNATFAALQLLLLALAFATYSIHFVVLSVLSAGLWYSINWFARELQAEKAKQEVAQSEDTKQVANTGDTRGKPAFGTVSASDSVLLPDAPIASTAHDLSTSSAYADKKRTASSSLRQRESIGDTSDNFGTDSEWEKVSEAEDKVDQ